jgi:hypothetical protein
MAWHHIIPYHEWRKRINSKATRTNHDYNALDNIVNLTTEQHALAHDFLYEINVNEFDAIAARMIRGQIGKEEAQVLIAREVGKRNKGRKATEETRLKLSNIRKGMPKTKEYLEWFKHNNPMNNQSSRDKVAQSKIGTPRDAQTRKKMSDTMKAKTHTSTTSDT